jgi:biotin carboxyl carrier protein
MKKLRITVEGKTYEVTVEMTDAPGSQPTSVGHAPQPGTPPPASTPSPAPIASAPAAASTATGPGIVTSPLSGKVVAIKATLGQRVQEGEELITIEAMKMNTFVFAPSTGSVAEIKVAVGDAVEEGQALFKLITE